MRLDLFLKLSRLVARRTLAQEMCGAGAIELNRVQAKSAHLVRVGDEIAIRHRGRMTTVRVIAVPLRQVSKADARSLYETLKVESYDSGTDVRSE